MMNYWTQSPENVFVAAHRGWRSRYPENTMSAFRAALELGVDQIETDVRVTKDGKLVLIHDAQVDRTTNGTGLVADFTFEELRKLDAGQGEQIPTLRELMELVKDHPTLTLDIELKEYPENVGEELAFRVCDEPIAMVEEYCFSHRVVINSFSGILNDYVYERYQGAYQQHVFFPLTKMRSAPTDPYRYAYCACACGLADGSTSVESVLEFHQNTGVRVWAGSWAKDEESIRLAQAIGTELITCDNPDEVLAILRKMNLHP